MPRLDTRATRLNSWMSRPGPRLLALGVLILVLLIPLAMIESRVQERGARRDEAAANVARSWGQAQVLSGPMLRLPYRVVTIERDGARSWEKVRNGWLVLAPHRLAVQGALDAEVRRRGIFEVPVYRAQLALRGEFRLPDLGALEVALGDVDFSRAELLLGVSAPGSIAAGSRVLVDGAPLALEPSAPSLGGAGVHAKLPTGIALARLEQGVGFELDLQLKGSSSLQLAPVARETTLSLSSNWPHPSFGGLGLPTRSEVSAQGFTADWSVSQLGRGYPSAWLDREVTREQIEAAAFGVDLCVPVDPYRMAERIAKYAALLVLLSFAAVWVMEVLGGRPLHAVQYLLLGGSLCLFGLLQLALAEHLGFGPAFVLAALAVVVQASWYAHTATGSARRACTLAALLAAWFAYLYAVLQAEDLAFLLGALALFAALSGVMWATRKVNWSGARADEDAAWDVADATVE